MVPSFAASPPPFLLTPSMLAVYLMPAGQRHRATRSTTGRTHSIDNQRMVINLTASQFTHLLKDVIKRFDMDIGNILAIATDNIDMGGKIQVVVGMVVIGNVKLVNQSEFFQRIYGIVDSCLADHRKDTPHTLENFGYGGMPAMLNEGLAHRVPLRGRSFAGRFELA